MKPAKDWTLDVAKALVGDLREGYNVGKLIEVIKDIQDDARQALRRIPLVKASYAGIDWSGTGETKGSIIHLIPAPDNPHAAFGAALCGSKPGSQSAGWDVREGATVTCTRCKSEED